MAKSPTIVVPPPASAPTPAPVSDAAQEIARLRAENARLQNQLGSTKPSREPQGPRVQLNLLGTVKKNGEQNTGYVTLFAGDGPDGKSLGVANGTVAFWRTVMQLLGANSPFAQEMLRAIAANEPNLKP